MGGNGNRAGFTSLPGLSYDSNGNLQNDSFHTYTWDAENRLTAVDTVGLTFDALGRMVEQARGSSYTEIVYAPTGNKLALMNGQTLQKAFCPLPGGSTAVYTSSGLAYYRHADWLGSSRFASTPSRTKYFDVAYAPYGEDYADSGTVDLNFTGQNQDTVSGMYDFLYREYHANSGRWIQPDPAGLAAANLGNPQTWNRYAYVGNIPLTAVDPLGLFTHWSDVFGTARMGGIDPLRDPGGAWLAAQLQQFMADAGLNSPLEQGMVQYLNSVPGYSVQGGNLLVSTGYILVPGYCPTGTKCDPDSFSTYKENWVNLGPLSGGSAANNGGIDWGWWKTFLKEAINPIPEFKQGGCGRAFLSATGDALNPFSPSLSSGGEATAAVLAASKYNAALRYAASAPNYLGGTGLIYPMKSSVVRSMLADANAAAASGGLITLDLALAQGFGTEMHSMATGGCH